MFPIRIAMPCSGCDLGIVFAVQFIEMAFEYGVNVISSFVQVELNLFSCFFLLMQWQNAT